MGKYRRRMDQLTVKRNALMVQGGAATRAEFEQRASWDVRRRELQAELDLANADLQAAAATEPELAIVEEDLHAYDAERNAECIVTLTVESQDLERDLQQAEETLGRVKQEVADLERDGRHAQLRFEREVVASHLKQLAEEWFSVQLAAGAVNQIRAKFERTCQPATLAAASRDLERLTCGKFRNIWTPLGKRQRCLDDDQNDTWLVEQLSGGTREQLFLAIRLALVREFSGKGIELPMVLDDVLVNFDQIRTEAAVDAMIDFTQAGQQILLFTCHLHIADLFERKGIQPIWLPGHKPPMEERRAG